MAFKTGLHRTAKLLVTQFARGLMLAILLKAQFGAVAKW
jgi:hypothetical protein